ncbi:hypothetical protein FOA52_008998 [Chlamydomonas sp. UWO 241]|nr:hypothetical protein FOA52_008998 [Chlamydomonas sp. UWO 241]
MEFLLAAASRELKGLQKYGDPVSDSDWEEEEPGRGYSDEEDGDPGSSSTPGPSGVRKGKSSRFIGVCWNKGKSVWQAQLRSTQVLQPPHLPGVPQLPDLLCDPVKKVQHLGYYASEEDAARAYDYEAVKIHGPDTRRNFPTLPADVGWRAVAEMALQPTALQPTALLPTALPSSRASAPQQHLPRQLPPLPDNPAKASQYVGVLWDKTNKWWVAQLRSKEGRRVDRVGRYGSALDAARAYDVAAVKTYGAKAQRNFPNEVITSAPPVVSEELRGRKTSSFVGVSWFESKSVWRARMRDPVLKKMVHIGYYATEEEAARAFDHMAFTMHGPDTKRNFPNELVTAPPVSTGERRRERKTSKYLGVSYHKGASAWRADLWDPQLQRRERIGSFASEEEAARAYDYTALQIQGPNAKRNFAELITEPPVSMGDLRRERKTSMYLGVSWFASKASWVAELWDPALQRRERLGSFASEEDAARAYDFAAVQLVGPQAKRNFAELVTEAPVAMPNKRNVLGEPTAEPLAERENGSNKRSRRKVS